MFDLENPQSPAYARLAGLAYLTIAVAGGFSIAYVPSELQVAGDIGATFERLSSQKGLFLAGIGGDVVVLIAEVLVTAMLFWMFRPVQPTLSLIAALARFAMVAVMAAMLLFHAGILAMISPETLPGLVDQTRHQIVHLLYVMHDAGVWVWQVFFWLHLLSLGALVLRSGAFPRLLGWGLMIGSFGYLLDSIYSAAFPDVALLGQLRVGLLVVVTLAEIGFALWLVSKGSRFEGQRVSRA